MTRTIPLKIQNEYIAGDKVLIGADGSHNDVVLRMEFSPMWEGLTKTVQFRDALGEKTIETLLTADLLEKNSTTVYMVPVPNGAKKYAGEMTLAVKGASVSGDKETRATTAVHGAFTVGESKWDTSAETEQDVPPTQAEQLQSQIDAVLGTINGAAASANAAAASAQSAAESAETATAAAGSIGNSVTAAAKSAAAAAASEKSAASSATAAASSATEAKANADAAAWSAANASTSATSAGKSASAASERASAAANSASAAATSAQTAQSAASTATDAAGTAGTAAEAASGSASKAQASAAAAADSEKNAEYWAGQAQQAAGGGVVSFNGRAGSVVPQAGDYDKGMVGLGNVDNTSDLAKPISTATQTALNAKQGSIIKGSVALTVAGWVADGDDWKQPVTIAGGAAGKQVDLEADKTAIKQMLEDGTSALYIANENGTFTAHAVGEKPTAALTLQTTMYDVKGAV